MGCGFIRGRRVHAESSILSTPAVGRKFEDFVRPLTLQILPPCSAARGEIMRCLGEWLTQNGNQEFHFKTEKEFPCPSVWQISGLRSCRGVRVCGRYGAVLAGASKSQAGQSSCESCAYPGFFPESPHTLTAILTM